MMSGSSMPRISGTTGSRVRHGRAMALPIPMCPSRNISTWYAMDRGVHLAADRGPQDALGARRIGQELDPFAHPLDSGAARTPNAEPPEPSVANTAGPAAGP